MSLPTKCDVCWDSHPRSECDYVAKALTSKKSYANKLQHAKNEEEEAAIEKKRAAIKPCPIKILADFCRTIIADKKVEI